MTVAIRQIDEANLARQSRRLGARAGGSGRVKTMLVLSRRVGERLLIGDDIVVTVIEVRSDGVRLGIEAPREVRVHRAEVIEAVRMTNVEAVEAGDATEAALRKLVPSGEPAGEPASEDAKSAKLRDAPKPGPVTTRTRTRR